MDLEASGPGCRIFSANDLSLSAWLKVQSSKHCDSQGVFMDTKSVSDRLRSCLSLQ